MRAPPDPEAQSGADAGKSMPDTQAGFDTRGIPLFEVGVRDVRVPLRWNDSRFGTASTVGVAELAVALPAQHKGTHMSRFLVALYAAREKLDPVTFEGLVRDVAGRLSARRARVSLEFPFHYEKRAPVSGEAGVAEIRVQLEGVLESGAFSLSQAVTVPVKTLCPCSKEISAFGAHNQRCHLTLITRGFPVPGFGEIVALADESASAPLFPVLKRADEKHITELAYRRPRFIEDIVREAALGLQGLPGCGDFEVRAVNHESIHDHDVFAVARARDLPPRQE